MNRKRLRLLAIGTTILTVTGYAYTLPALAEQPQPVPEQSQPVSPQPVTQSTIPQSTAITVAFLTPMEIDLTQEQEYPTAVRLVQPILDSNGNVVAPQNSLVSVKLKPDRDGVKIVAESLVIGGRVVPIQTSSPMIPGRTVTVKTGTQRAQENSPLFSSLLGSIAGFASEGQLTQPAGLLGTGIGILTGLTSSKKVHMVQIPQGSMYVLTLEAPVAIASPPQPMQNQSNTVAP